MRNNGQYESLSTMFSPVERQISLQLVYNYKGVSRSCVDSWFCEIQYQLLQMLDFWTQWHHYDHSCWWLVRNSLSTDRLLRAYLRDFLLVKHFEFIGDLYMLWFRSIFRLFRRGIPHVVVLGLLKGMSPTSGHMRPLHRTCICIFCITAGLGA